jgi:inner membrane transporter RhtA
VLPGPSSDYLGVGLGLLAAACWAAYILLNRLLGNRLPGLQAPAAATAVSALLYLPAAGFIVTQGQLHSTAVLYAIGAGVLSSVVPYAADLIVLRRVPARFFGVIMSIHPVLAALAGLVILQQVLDLHEWAGIVVVVIANILAVAAAQAQSRTTGSATGSSFPRPAPVRPRPVRAGQPRPSGPAGPAGGRPGGCDGDQRPACLRRQQRSSAVLQ